MNCNLLKYCAIAVAFCMALTCVNAQFDDKPLTDICLGCMCEAISGCNQTKACVGEICGLFHITYAYWRDGGSLTLPNELPDSPDAYPHCATDPYCAANTMQGYMKKFGQDCNDDRVVDCLDYFRIHKLGGYGCRGELDIKQNLKLTTCLNEYSTGTAGTGKIDVRMN